MYFFLKIFWKCYIVFFKIMKRGGKMKKEIGNIVVELGIFCDLK